MTREERNNLIDKLEQLRFFNQRAGRELWGNKPQEMQDEDIKNTDTILEMAISALSENKCGKWKRTYLDHVAMGERPSILYCSVCHQCIAYPTNYCPNCGADMRGET